MDQPSIDDREFSAERDICRECGADLSDDRHTITCSFNAEFWEPDVDDDYEFDGWDDGGTGGME